MSDNNKGSWYIDRYTGQIYFFSWVQVDAAIKKALKFGIIIILSIIIGICSVFIYFNLTNKIFNSNVEYVLEKMSFKLYQDAPPQQNSQNFNEKYRLMDTNYEWYRSIEISEQDKETIRMYFR